MRSRSVSDVPETPSELVADIEQGWIIDDRHFDEGEFEGQSYQYSVWAKRAK